MALAVMSERAAVACAVLIAMLPLAGAADAMQDRIEMTRSSDRWLVDVYHQRGIGGVRLSTPESAWPETFLVRLHGFQELESFTAFSTEASFECALVRLEGQPPVQTCRLGAERVDALKRAADYFEVKLPHAMFPPDNEAIEIRWVDQWR